MCCCPTGASCASACAPPPSGICSGTGMVAGMIAAGAGWKKPRGGGGALSAAGCGGAEPPLCALR
eukprot:2106444-Prymnesium_polylepis.1